MGLIVPWPGVPQDGQPVEATTLAANLDAVYQSIQSFDAAQVASRTLSAGAFAASINPNTILHDTISAFVQSGCIWSTVSGLSGTMSAGVIYVGTSTSVFRVSVTGVGSNTFTASSDTYIDVDYNGNVTYNAVANNASAPALTANSIRIAKVVTNGSAITAILQTAYDSNNVPIYSQSPLLGKKYVDANGWTVYEMGAWKEYAKTVTYSGTVTPGQVVNVNTSNLPVGYSTVANIGIEGTNFVVWSKHGGASVEEVGWGFGGISSSDTYFTIYFRNNNSGNISAAFVETIFIRK